MLKIQCNPVYERKLPFQNFLILDMYCVYIYPWCLYMSVVDREMFNIFRILLALYRRLIIVELTGPKRGRKNDDGGVSTGSCYSKYCPSYFQLDLIIRTC